MDDQQKLFVSSTEARGWKPIVTTHANTFMRYGHRIMGIFYNMFPYSETLEGGWIGKSTFHFLDNGYNDDPLSKLNVPKLFLSFIKSNGERVILVSRLRRTPSGGFTWGMEPTISKMEGGILVLAGNMFISDRIRSLGGETVIITPTGSLSKVFGEDELLMLVASIGNIDSNSRAFLTLESKISWAAEQA